MTEFLEILGVLAAIISLGVFAAYTDFSSQKKTIKYANNDFDRERQYHNLKILTVLAEYTVANPSQRFGQILRNTGVLVDIGVKDSSQEEWETADFYFDRSLVHEEPQVTLSRMENVLANQYDYDIVIKVKKK